MRGIDDIKEFEASTGSGDEAAKRHDDGLRPDEEEPDRRPRAGHGPGVQIAAPEKASTPASSSTRALSSLLVGSMIRDSTSWANTSSPPTARSNPSTR